MVDREVDVVVVGAGNAAMCAALAACERGAEVVVLEAAPESESGGNSRYTAGAMRVAFEGAGDLARLMDLSASEIENTEFGRYTREQYYDDMARVTRYRCHPDLVEVLVENSLDTLIWMRSKGVRFQPSYGRQAFKAAGGRFRFWGGLAVETWGGGPGLVESLAKACGREGIGILHESRALSLIEEDGAVRGVVVRGRDGAFTGAGEGGRARLRGVRIERRMAHPLPRPRLGPRAGAGDALQRRGRDPHGARSRRDALRELVGMPRRGMGSECAGIRGPLGGRRLPEAQLSVRHHGQCERRALRG